VPGTKTNERPGTRAVLRHYRMSAYKARQVLDLVRGEDITTAHEILRSTPREGARVIDKVLHSAVSNAVENSRQAGAAIDPEELYISACFADEGTTLKRWRPRARGRATRIRKRTCHITVIVSRLDDERIARLRVKRTEATAALRSRRVAASRLRRRPDGGDDAGTDAAEGGNRRLRRSRGAGSDAAADATDEAETDEVDTDEDETDADSAEAGDDSDVEAEVEVDAEGEAGDGADGEAEADVDAEAEVEEDNALTDDTGADEAVDDDGNGETD
jgi:large subunit ribosomal protein L22